MLISIIIPTYNSGKYIKRCLDSWNKQTDHSIELIIIDDGSTDATKKMLDGAKKWMSKDILLKTIYLNHQGVSKARNIGLNEASGDIIGFCDSDDVVNKKLIEYLIETFELFSCEIAYCYAEKLSNDNCLDFVIDEKTSDCKIIPSVGFLKEKVLFDDSVYGSVWNKYFKRNIIKDHFFDESLTHCEDLHFLYTLLNKYPYSKIVNMENSFYGYVHHGENVICDYDNLFDKSGYLKYCIAIDKIIETCNNDKKVLNAKKFELVGSVLLNKKYKSKVHAKLLKKSVKGCIWDYMLFAKYRMRHRIKMVVFYYLCNIAG